MAFATPTEHPQPHVSPAPSRSPDPTTTAFKGAGNQKIVGDNYVNPYKNGPSALDKAAQLFFFTEIVRGVELHYFKVRFVLEGLL